MFECTALIDGGGPLLHRTVSSTPGMRLVIKHARPARDCLRSGRFSVQSPLASPFVTQQGLYRYATNRPGMLRIQQARGFLRTIKQGGASALPTEFVDAEGTAVFKWASAQAAFSDNTAVCRHPSAALQKRNANGGGLFQRAARRQLCALCGNACD